MSVDVALVFSHNTLIKIDGLLNSYDSEQLIDQKYAAHIHIHL